MISLRLILMLLALICFMLSAGGVGSRVNLQSAGLAFLVLERLIA